MLKSGLFRKNKSAKVRVGKWKRTAKIVEFFCLKVAARTSNDLLVVGIQIYHNGLG